MSEGSRLFDGMASGYDANHSRNVPDPEGLYGAVVDGLPFGVDDELRVLDLGAGTGLLSAVISAGFPRAKVTLADFSAEMLEVARQRLGDTSGRFEFVVMDYVRDPLAGDEGGYDMISSALSLHHITDDYKRRTFSGVYDALSPGGVFVNADKVPDGSPVAGQEHHDHHHGWTAAGLETQMEWLREAGFDEVESRYEKGGFAVYRGLKSSRER